MQTNKKKRIITNKFIDMENLTPSEIEKKYKQLLKNTNLSKLGKMLLQKSVDDSQDGIYNQYNFLRKYLSLNNIPSSRIIPSKRNKFYSEDLQEKAYSEFFNSLK